MCVDHKAQCGNEQNVANIAFFDLAIYNGYMLKSLFVNPAGWQSMLYMRAGY